MSKNEFSEQTVLFISIVKWVVLASAIGLIVGLTSAGFIRLLDFSIEQASKYWYMLLTIPLSLFIVALIKLYVYPKEDVETTNQVIGSIHSAEEISWKSALKAFFLPIITIAGGGSAGKEAPCADVGAASGSLLARWLRFSDVDRRKLMICGVSAGFSAVFGTPIAGAIFGVEVLFVGGILYEILLPSFIAGLIAFHVASSLGVTGLSHLITVVPEFNRSFFFIIIAAGIFFGLVSFLMVELNYRIKKIATSIKWWSPLKALAAGGVLAIMASIFSSLYLGLGLETIEYALVGGQIVLYAFLVKMIMTSITVNFGGSGGLITPVLFVGATAGALFAHIFHADPVIFAAVGLVAVLSGVANTPIAASILAIEVFGPAIASFAAVACVISFLMTGHRSLFSNQVLAARKSSSIKVEGKRMGRLKTKIVPRKSGVLKYAIRARKESEKMQKKYVKIINKYKKKL
jgi:H+/Cl- antiporter ClcA